jgi:hypothetical protein
MRTLELFAGTQSFSKGVKRLDPINEAITLDLLDKFSPTIHADILTWDYTIFPVGHFDIIWASPPCTEYSKAKTRGIRNLDLADSFVRKAFEIIDYFQPIHWVVENVATGLLPARMQTLRPGLNSYLVDYCVYGKPYRKRTILWSNRPLHLGLCPGASKCPQMDSTKHRGSVGNGTSRYNQANIKSVWEKDEIPAPLIDAILSQVAKTDSGRPAENGSSPRKETNTARPK